MHFRRLVCCLPELVPHFFDGCVLEALLSREAVDVFANGAVGFDELRLRDDSRNHRVPW